MFVSTLRILNAYIPLINSFFILNVIVCEFTSKIACNVASALFSRITFNLTPIFPSDTNCPCCETIPVSPVSTFVIPVPSSFIPVAMYFLPSVSNPF